MARRNVLERLWRLRELEEEQSRLGLEAELRERDRIAERLDDAERDAWRGRAGFAAHLADPDTAARTASLLEEERARRRQRAIEPALRQAEGAVEARRGDFLERRTERRQVETLLDREREVERAEVARRAQQMLDDWYGRRGPRRKPAEEKADLPRILRYLP